jgi:hypothetical protein
METSQIKSPFNEKSSVLSLDKAVEIFDLLADRTDIAFGYSRDGCYARAHIMCRTLIDMGLAPKKAWAFEGQKSLCVEKPDKTNQMWCFHVAPVLSVEMPDGKIQNMVLDPSLFDGPVSLKEWGDIMHASPDKLQVAPFGVVPEGRYGDYTPHSMTSSETDKEAAEKMKEYLQWQGSAPRIVFSSQSRQQACQMPGIQLRTQGMTWVSAQNPLPALSV